MLKENYLIDIEGVMQQSGGEPDTVHLITKGSFLRKNGSYFISYQETTATGYQGNVTTVKAEGSGKVSMLRFGPQPSQLVIERGRRHVCHYDSGYGVLSLGVAADEIENSLTDAGGHLMFSYTLDTGSTHVSHNQVKITVQEAKH